MDECFQVTRRGIDLAPVEVLDRVEQLDGEGVPLPFVQRSGGHQLGHLVDEIEDCALGLGRHIQLDRRPVIAATATVAVP